MAKRDRKCFAQQGVWYESWVEQLSKMVPVDEEALYDWLKKNEMAMQVAQLDAINAYRARHLVEILKCSKVSAEELKKMLIPAQDIQDEAREDWAEFNDKNPEDAEHEVEDAFKRYKESEGIDN
jgi:hypothetical protein